MRKIRLKIAELAVDSFHPADDDRENAGTVLSREVAAGWATFPCPPTSINTCAQTRLGAPCLCP